MDTSSAAAECVTLQAAGGFNIHLFPTGQGNIIGNPIEPVIKLTANPLTVKTMSEHIDVDVSKILSRQMNLDQAGDELIKATLRVANGRLTCAEALGHKEFVMTKLYRSAWWKLIIYFLITWIFFLKSEITFLTIAAPTPSISANEIEKIP